MASFQNLSFRRTLLLETFEQLGQVLQQMAQAVGTGAVVLTEAVLSSIPMPTDRHLERFTVLVSQRFSALLVGDGEMGSQRRAGVPRHEAQRREPPFGFAVPYGGKPSFRAVSPHASGSPVEATGVRWGDGETFGPSSVNASLTFDPNAIALFLSQLSDLLQHNPQAQQTLDRYRQILQPNDATLQSEFTLLLMSILVPEQNPEPTPPVVYPHVSVCQPVEDALRHQIAHERLLNQVTTQIRQSLDLPAILATAVDRVREFLQLDRLVIYQFEEEGVSRRRGGFNQHVWKPKSMSVKPARTGVRSQESGVIFVAEAPPSPHPPIPSSPHPPISHMWQQHSGCIIYEARATESIPSVLNYKEESCFVPTSQCWEKYRQGFTLVVDNVETAYTLSKCLLAFLRATQVQAKLVAPIVVQEKLWGLLIAHQCLSPRHWLDSEKNLLRQIAEQLAIAIYQAELMQSLKQEKQTLEQRVTERTQALYDALIAAQTASRAKSEFLATMSHELRTPLTRVIGMSSTLLRLPLGNLQERQRHYLQTIHDSGEHLLELINEILELSQVEAGKAVLNISEFSLVELAEASLRSLSQQAKQQEVDLSLDLKIEPPDFRFSADQKRVRKILWNLLSNAVKFTPVGGNVTLRVWVEGNTAVFQVEDTGIGIPEHQLSLLFEKFQQLDTSYRRRYEGTGLGLALTKQLVELHRGRIEVESTVGVGSIFTVWLPAQPSL